MLSVIPVILIRLPVSKITPDYVRLQIQNKNWKLLDKLLADNPPEAIEPLTDGMYDENYRLNPDCIRLISRYKPVPPQAIEKAFRYVRKYRLEFGNGERESNPIAHIFYFYQKNISAEDFKTLSRYLSDPSQAARVTALFVLLNREQDLHMIEPGLADILKNDTKSSDAQLGSMIALNYCPKLKETTIETLKLRLNSRKWHIRTKAAIVLLNHGYFVKESRSTLIKSMKEKGNRLVNRKEIVDYLRKAGSLK